MNFRTIANQWTKTDRSSQSTEAVSSQCLNVLASDLKDPTHLSECHLSGPSKKGQSLIDRQDSRSKDAWQAKTALAFWLARTINPPVRPSDTFQVDLSALRQLPKGTLGRELVLFLDRHQFELPQTGDWVQQTHDIWHVLTGLTPASEDEFILQAFVRAQVFRPSSAIVVLVGLVTGQLSWTSLRRSLRLGRMAQQISHWDIETDWATPLADVREKLGIHRQGIIRQTKGFKKAK